MKYFTIILLIPTFIISCSKDDAEPDDDKVDCSTVMQATYTDEIKSIIDGTCSIEGCHNGSNSSLPSLTNYDEVFARRSGIRNQVESKNMPPAGALSQELINLIACWVENGAPE